MRRNVAGVVVIEVAQLRAGLQCRGHRVCIARERYVEHGDFVASGRFDTPEQRNVALHTGNQFRRARLLQPQLMQRADAIRIAVENIIE